MATPSHATAKDLVLQALTSSEQTGLSASQVTAAREQFGWNELATVAPEPAWKKFLAQFSDVVVWILIAEAFVSGAMGEWTDTAAIVTIVQLITFLVAPCIYCLVMEWQFRRGTSGHSSGAVVPSNPDESRPA